MDADAYTCLPGTVCGAHAHMTTQFCQDIPPRLTSVTVATPVKLPRPREMWASLTRGTPRTMHRSHSSSASLTVRRVPVRAVIASSDVCELSVATRRDTLCMSATWPSGRHMLAAMSHSRHCPPAWPVRLPRCGWSDLVHHLPRLQSSEVMQTWCTVSSRSVAAARVCNASTAHERAQ